MIKRARRSERLVDKREVGYGPVERVIHDPWLWLEIARHDFETFYSLSFMTRSVLVYGDVGECVFRKARRLVVIGFFKLFKPTFCLQGSAYSVSTRPVHHLNADFENPFGPTAFHMCDYQRRIVRDGYVFENINDVWHKVKVHDFRARFVKCSDEESMRLNEWCVKYRDNPYADF